MNAASLAVDSVLPRNPVAPSPANRQVAAFLAVTGATLAVGVTFIGVVSAVVGLHLEDYGPPFLDLGLFFVGALLYTVGILRLRRSAPGDARRIAIWTMAGTLATLGAVVLVLAITGEL